MNFSDRFDEIFKAGDFIDTYRKFVPYGSPKIDTNTEYTWRGNRPVNVPYSPFYGKGMRIDYFLVQAALEKNVKSSKILGFGIDRAGFLGSDHCPIELVLHFENSEANDLSTELKNIDNEYLESLWTLCRY